jgi:RHS repeat-associated protein
LTNTFDAANRLIETTHDGITVEPIYNGVNDRVAQTVGLSTTNYALDVAGGLPEVIYTSEGNLYLHLPGVIMAENAEGEVRYLLSDGLGSVRQAVDDNGAVVAYHEFDPYGNPNPQSLTPNPYGFTGEWWENDVGLLHLRARWSETGTFLSVDPVEGEPPYQYVRGNPVNRIDPSGMQQGDLLDPNRPECYEPISRPGDICPPGCTLPPQCYEPKREGDIYDIYNCPPPPRPSRANIVSLLPSLPSSLGRANGYVEGQGRSVLKDLEIEVFYGNLKG